MAPLALFDREIFDPNIFDTASVRVTKTVADFLTATLKLINAIAKSETPSPDEFQDSLDRFRSMLDTWAADRLTIFSVVPTTFPLLAGKQSYSIGLGGADFNVPRPLWIENAGIISTANALQPFELPVRVLDDSEWASITIKNVASQLAWYLWYDYAFQGPLGWGNIKVWPIPTASTTQLVLYLPTPLTNFISLQEALILPPGWEEALRTNLAIRLCPEFGRPVDPVVAKLAIDGYAMLCRANKREQLLSVDAALVSESNGVWNWLTGASGTRGR
jgi:hypothetical protein